MDFVALRYFHETARCGSIRRAADHLHVTPSSISRMITALEHEFGAPLFERSKHGMRLTDAGILLEQHTHRVFRNLRRVKDMIDDLKNVRRGEVTVHCAEGLVADFMPSLLAEFHTMFPEVSFNIIIASTDQIVRALVDDETDIGITFNGPARRDLSAIAELSDPLRCLVQPGHPLSLLESASMAEVCQYYLALPDSSFGMRQMINDATAHDKISPKILMSTNSLEMAKRLAMTGAAVAFMPEFMVKHDIARGRLLAVPVRSGIFSRSRVTVCIHRQRGVTFAAQELLNFLKTRFQDMAAPVEGVAFQAT